MEERKINGTKQTKRIKILAAWRTERREQEEKKAETTRNGKWQGKTRSGSHLMVMNDVIKMHMPYLCEKFKVNAETNCSRRI